MHTVSESAFAKINLYLNVEGKRDDGFHTVRTVMHTVSLCDRVSVTVTPAPQCDIRLSVSGARGLPTDERNLAVRAAKLFLERSGKRFHTEITLEKNLPVAAGLAGGSSDAAAVLRAMNRLAGKPFTRGALAVMARELGSDVPYCVLGGTMLCLGRGEQMTPVAGAPHLFCVIAHAGERVSTPAAYAALDVRFADFDGSVPFRAPEDCDMFLKKLKNKEIKRGSLYNIFEEVILPQCPGAAALRENMYAFGANVAMMSGSGSAVFGLFSSMEAAEDCAAKLRRVGVFAAACESVC